MGKKNHCDHSTLTVMLVILGCLCVVPVDWVIKIYITHGVLVDIFAKETSVLYAFHLVLFTWQMPKWIQNRQKEQINIQK